LNQVIRVDPGIDSPQLPSGREPLKLPRFGLILNGEP
jgi:hypothetical protein